MVLDIYAELGLNKYEAKAYEYLCSLGAVRASEVASVANIPRTKIYEVLAALKGKGWVYALDQVPQLFGAVSPELIMKARLQEKITTMQEQNRKLIESLQQPYDIGYAQAEIIPPDSIPFPSEASLMEDMQEMIDKARWRVYFCILPAQFLEEAFKKLEIPEKLKVWVLARKEEKLPQAVKERADKITIANVIYEQKGGYFVVDGEHFYTIWTEPGIMGTRLLFTRDRLKISEELEDGMNTGVIK